MRESARLSPEIESPLRHREPLLWINPRWQRLEDARLDCPVSLERVCAADDWLRRHAPLLCELFPELAATRGIIESPLLPADQLKGGLGQGALPGRWLIKADHALPVAGSIKARGGIYEVLQHAEQLARRHEILPESGEPMSLCLPSARSLFAHHRVAVGSTGNLGLSIGIMAAALGFKARVHMSGEAKAWKVRRLEARGVEVIQHTGDFGAAVAAGRALAQRDPRTYFIDDEKSWQLFVGYATAGLRLKQQLCERRIEVSASHPLFVYLPCGVGGSPGGITFGLRQLFGDYVHCFFAEPVDSPCMLVRLASAENRSISVTDVGLDGRTDADGLAVARASEIVAQAIRPLVSGFFTVPDDDLFRDLYILERTEALRIEPSAAAGFRGPEWLLNSEPGHAYLRAHQLWEHLHAATHVLWTTGGAFVPNEEYQLFRSRGRSLVLGHA